MGSIPGLGRSCGVGNGNPLQFSCLGNSMDRGTWQVQDHGITKNQTRLSTHTHTHTIWKYEGIDVHEGILASGRQDPLGNTTSLGLLCGSLEMPFLTFPRRSR